MVGFQHFGKKVATDGRVALVQSQAEQPPGRDATRRAVANLLRDPVYKGIVKFLRVHLSCHFLQLSYIAGVVHPLIDTRRSTCP